MTVDLVTLEQVVAAAQKRYAPVAPETAGYLALAVADALVLEPRAVGVRSIALAGDGHLEIARADAPVVSSPEAEASVRELLRALLAVAGGTTPSLVAVSKRASGAGVGALVRELEAALIPVNRGASKRALGRLSRETAKAFAEKLASLPPADASAAPAGPSPAASAPAPAPSAPRIAAPSVAPPPRPAPATPPPRVAPAPSRAPTPEPPAVEPPEPDLGEEPADATERMDFAPRAEDEPSLEIDVALDFDEPAALAPGSARRARPRARAARRSPPRAPGSARERAPVEAAPPAVDERVEPRAPAEPSGIALESESSFDDSSAGPPPIAFSEPSMPSRLDDLVASFAAGVTRSDREHARELKATVGLDPTPPPPAVAPTIGAGTSRPPPPPDDDGEASG